ncbi:MAG TPA: cyclic pyranopterin monophosphate synthase MoaC [Capsulimonadaceae bacterium]|nr:cyclic pyranopterin monophosphate synthase MoaC [Capsulimonadaceae bacterium]
MSEKLTHVDEHGKARMVDISEKPSSAREAVARAVLHMKPETRALIERNGLAKGDALAVARVAGILAAKRVDELIPLCHTLPLASVQIDFHFEETGLVIQASAATVAQTGVEMEALTAATIAALTVYDMAKAVDKAMAIENVHLVKKTGGKSGDFVAPAGQRTS